MIGVTNIALFVLYFALLPFVIGLLWTRKWSHYEMSIAMTVSAGFMVLLAAFNVFAVPMILLRQPYHLLVLIWKIFVWMMFWVSFAINYRRICPLFKKWFAKFILVTTTERLIWLSVFFLLIFQIYMPVGHMRVDTDDARFVGEAMEAYELDTMLQYHPLTGVFLGEQVGEMHKDMAAPFPFFMALGGSLLHLPPAVSTHIFFPVIFILMAYVVYYLLGDYFLHGNSKYTALFLFFMSWLHCFAYESIYAAGYTLLAVIWQGRSVLAMVIMPFIWLLLMRIVDQEDLQNRYYYLLLCSVLAGLLTSSMAIELLGVLVGTYSVIIWIKNKKIESAIAVFLTLIPCVLCYCIYRW